MINPTARTYGELRHAYDFFNAELFGGRLPGCLITLRNKGKRTLGYFASERFGAREGGTITDEIALNATHFLEQPIEFSLSILVHEMTHLQQHHQGKPSRTGHHNKEWGCLMRDVGLIPTHTGEPGGRETGQQVIHYIEPGGRFDVACKVLLATGFTLSYFDQWPQKDREKKLASKTKYTCPNCKANAWGKPDSNIVCGQCDCIMRAPDDDGAINGYLDEKAGGDSEIKSIIAARNVVDALSRSFEASPDGGWFVASKTIGFIFAAAAHVDPDRASTLLALARQSMSGEIDKSADLPARQDGALAPALKAQEIY